MVHWGMKPYCFYASFNFQVLAAPELNTDFSNLYTVNAYV